MFVPHSFLYMKKLFSILLCLCVSIVAMAQDVIVKKDGSTIISKVLEISDAQIKYKTHDNQSGPTYTISSSEVLRINYPNGSSYTPSNNQQTVQEEQKVTFEEIDEPIGQRVSDEELLKMWRMNGNNMDYKKWEKTLKKGKTIRNIGWIYGCGLAVSGVVLYVCGDVDICCEPLAMGGACLFGVGVITGTTLIACGNHKVKQAKHHMLQSASIFQKDFKLGNNTNLTTDVNIMKDNVTRQQALGLGFHLDF